MKIIKIFFSLSIVFFTVSCGDDSEYFHMDVPPVDEVIEDSIEIVDTIKILAIGNSYTFDGMYQLPAIMQSMEIANVNLGMLRISSSALSEHYNAYMNDFSMHIYEKSESGNAWDTISLGQNLRTVIKEEDWDIIVLQEYSQLSGIYYFYQPYLDDLIKMIREDSKNKDVTIAWHMTWAYSTNCTLVGFNRYGKNQDTMYNGIVDAVESLKKDTGISLIIPSGEVIQNLRKSSINNTPLDLTRDGSHIDLGAGRYALACTWFETLIAPKLKVSMLGNPFRLAEGYVNVTNTNSLLIQKEVYDVCNSK